MRWIFRVWPLCVLARQVTVWRARHDADAASWVSLLLGRPTPGGDR